MCSDSERDNVHVSGRSVQSIFSHLRGGSDEVEIYDPKSLSQSRGPHIHALRRLPCHSQPSSCRAGSGRVAERLCSSSARAGHDIHCHEAEGLQIVGSVPATDVFDNKEALHHMQQLSRVPMAQLWAGTRRKGQHGVSSKRDLAEEVQWGLCFHTYKISMNRFFELAPILFLSENEDIHL